MSIEDLIRHLTEQFTEGRLDLSARPEAPEPGWQSLPEFRAATRLRERGASDPEVRMFITLVAALDRARDAEKLWDAATALHETAPWVFDAVDVLSRPQVDLAQTLKEARVSQRHGPDVDGWRSNLELLANPLKSGGVRSVEAAIVDGIGDAVSLLSAVDPFKFLRGPKISRMWVRMLVAPGGAQLDRLERLPVAVDVQVRKVTEYLGVTDTAKLSLDQARPIIQAAWQRDAAVAVGPLSLAGTASAVDPALWFFGKWGCTFCEQRFGRQEPISSLCSACTFRAKGAGSSFD